MGRCHMCGRFMRAEANSSCGCGRLWIGSGAESIIQEMDPLMRRSEVEALIDERLKAYQANPIADMCGGNMRNLCSGTEQNGGG